MLLRRRFGLVFGVSLVWFLLSFAFVWNYFLLHKDPDEILVVLPYGLHRECQDHALLTNCPNIGGKRCRISTNRDELPIADVVLQQVLQIHKGNKAKVRPDQLNAIYITESAANYPKLSMAEFMAQFNFSVSYRYHNRTAMRSLFRPNGPMPVRWPISASYNYSFDAALQTEITASNSAFNPFYLASYFASNCKSAEKHSHRNELAKQLENYGVYFAAFGSCAAKITKFPLPKDVSERKEVQAARGEVERKLKWMKMFKFHFAFENSNCEDYVTEKLWQPLIVGTIPIYWGAPGFRLVPENSVIFVEDFPNISALAQHIHQVNTNDTLFESYHAWRKKPLTGDFYEFYRASKEPDAQDMACLLCAAAYDPRRVFQISNSSQRVIAQPEPECKYEAFFHQPNFSLSNPTK